MAGARRVAVEVLIRIHRDSGFSNIVLDTALRENNLSSADKGLVSRLVYGVTERRLTIDYVLGQFCTMKLTKMHPAVAEILRTGVYQLLFMDKIPVSAAVNEAVKLAKAMGQYKAAGMVNAVLRNVDRKRDTLFDRLPKGAQGDAVRYSVPADLVVCWQKAYGRDITDGLLQAVNVPPPQYLRVNTLKISVEDFTKRLTDAGVPYTVHPDLPAAVHIPAGIDWKGLAKWEENWYYYQDTASQYCCFALGARPHEHIADVCAAPGGKSFTVAQYMQNDGRILAGDIYPAKCETIENRAKDFGITCIQTVVRDATKPIPATLKGAFDRVICDAPCSGLGVIRRKPEIRYKSLAEFNRLPALQLEILSRAAQMVKSGGVLQYSTCTLRPEENEQVAATFLEAHPDFVPQILPLDACFEKAGLAPSHQITLFPHIHETDGFFIASFRKK